LQKNYIKNFFKLVREAKMNKILESIKGKLIVSCQALEDEPLHMKEVKSLIDEGVQIIAIDATKRERPDKRELKDLITEIKEKYPNQLIMADVSSVDEALYAEKIGFDIVGTTLVGYTEYTKNYKALEELEKVLKVIKIPVIAEGNIDTPLKAKKALELGAFAVVVGGAITRPQQITKKFVDEMEKI